MYRSVFLVDSSFSNERCIVKVRRLIESGANVASNDQSLIAYHYGGFSRDLHLDECTYVISSATRWAQQRGYLA